jgi:ketosteroid isomerase-like protein
MVFSVLLTIMSLMFNAAFADTEQDHEMLRNLRTQATAALNTNNFSQIEPLLSRNFTITTVDNHKFTNLEEFKNYWQSLFDGKNAILKSIQIDPKADALTEFLSPDIGIVYGTSDDTYHFTDGDSRKMATRWTAVVKRETDGWKLVALHFSANLMDNPVLAAAKTCAYWYAAAGVITGCILGILIMLGMRRKA